MLALVDSLVLDSLVIDLLSPGFRGSVDAVTGERVVLRGGFAVAADPDVVAVFDGSVGAVDLANYLVDHGRVSGVAGTARVVFTVWHNERDGRTYLTLAYVFEGVALAMRFARRLGIARVLDVENQHVLAV